MKSLVEQLGATDVELIRAELQLAGIFPGMESLIEAKAESTASAIKQAEARAIGPALGQSDVVSTSAVAVELKPVETVEEVKPKEDSKEKKTETAAPAAATPGGQKKGESTGCACTIC